MNKALTYKNFKKYGRKKKLRKITKIKRSVRAISPIMATLLLIAIVVAASLLAYAWIMGYIEFKRALNFFLTSRDYVTKWLLPLFS